MDNLPEIITPDDSIAKIFSLKDYQIQACNFVLSRQSSGLFLKMGLGKTRITLACICKANLPCHVLVIAPAAIARTSWTDEIKELGINLRWKSFMTGPRGGKLPKKKRLERYREVLTDPPTIYFIGRELVTDIVNYYGKKKIPFPFRFIVIDELQSFKSYSSARFKSLQKVLPYVEHVIGLTGTPAPNGIMDLWAQVYLLDRGKRLGDCITRYRESYFTPGLYVNGHPVTWNPLPGAEEAIKQKINSLCISMDNDMLDLPPLTVNDLRAYMDEEETALYKRLMRDKVLELADADIMASNAAALSSKLMQLASGNIYTDLDGNFVHIHDRKIELLGYIMDNEPEPVLVAYYFKSDLKRLKERFPEAVVFDSSPQMLKAWNEGKIRMLLIHPASAGFGLNFQYGGSTLVWYTLTWNLEQYLQTNARLHRQNQTRPVVIHRLLTADTIDLRIAKILEKKDANQEDLLEAVKLTLDIK